MVFEKVAEMIAERIDAEASTIKLETKFSELGIDSLDVMELVMEMEDVFNTEIDVNNTKLETVSALVSLIESTMA